VAMPDLDDAVYVVDANPLATWWIAVNGRGD
jgi:hypothetical protein